MQGKKTFDLTSVSETTLMPNKNKLLKKSPLKGQRSLVTTILTVIIVIVTVVSASSLAINLSIIAEESEKQLQEKMNVHLIYLKESLSRPLWNYDFWPIREFGRAMMANDNVVVLSILDDDGKIIFDETKQFEKPQFERSEKIMYRDSKVGYFKLGLNDFQYLRQRKQIITVNIVTSLAIIVCLLAIVMTFVKKLIRQPLETFSRRIESIAGGDYKTLKKDAHPSELNSVLNNFNHMAVEIASREKSLTETNVKLRVEIEERTKIEELLRDSENQYKQLIENAIDSIFIAQDGLIKFSNQKTAELIGYSTEELKTIPFPEFIHPDDRELVLGYHIRRMKGDLDLPTTYSFRIVAKDRSEAIVQINTILIEWDGKPATLNFVRDITDQKKLEESFHQAQKLEAIGTLAGGIAHDFNNLLMGIQGRSSLLAINLLPEDPNQEHLEAIKEYVSSATNLTSQLLGTARGGKYEPKPVHINVLIHKSSTMFSRTKKEIQVFVELSKLPIVVEVDRQQIEQVLLNMYLNAWQAMPGGGELRLKSSVSILDKSYCEAYRVSPGHYAVISITDNGIGMDKTTRSQIFDPFFTTREMGRGTGLGLASAYGIIKNHEGFITVYSEIGHGTTFNIYLPISEKTVHQDDAVEPELIKGSETILLVDDEEMILEVSKALLEELGYKAIIAKGGEQAIQIIKAEDSNIDLVILDMIMPGMDGGKTFEQIRDHNPQLPVILSSGYAINSQATEILDKGCKGFIQKPFSLADLSQKVRNVLNEQ